MGHEGPKVCGGCGSGIGSGCATACSCSGSCGDAPLWMYRGDTHELRARAPEDACAPPWNLTGWEARFTAKAATGLPDNHPQTIRLGTALPLTGVTIDDPISGSVVVTIPATATALFPDTPVCLVWDVQVRNPSSGAIRTIAQGTLTVYPNVTRGLWP